MHPTLATLALLTSLFAPAAASDRVEARLAQAHELASAHPDQALRTYRLACAGEVGPACLWAASLGRELGVSEARVQRWNDRGVALTADTCEHTDPARDGTNACGMLAAIYAYGQGMPANPGLAAAYGARASLAHDFAQVR